MKLPDEFVLPFRFQGDPVMTAEINGIPCSRCVLDTGAATTVMRIPNDSDVPGLELEENNTALVKSLRINSVEFGPLRVRVKKIAALNASEIYLGTEQIKERCLTLDYQGQRALFSHKPFTCDLSGWTAIGFSNGRPVIHFDFQGRKLTFVLDTGSDGNWLFLSGQKKDLLDLGRVETEGVEAYCGLGDVRGPRRTLTLSEIDFGGVTHRQVKFLLADAQDFGGTRNAPEDGVIGTGAIAGWFSGLQIIDFIANRFYLR